MSRALIFLVTLLASLSSASIFAAEQSKPLYVSDDIGIVMRSGPTNGYRVTGRVTAGTPIEVLASDEENKTTQIKIASGKTGWISSQYVSEQKSFQVQLEEALAGNNQLRDEVTGLTHQISDKQKIIAENDMLQQQVSELHNKVEQLEQRASLGKDRFRTDMFFAGGLTVLVSMFIAWLITRATYSRRSKSGWR